MYDILLIIGGKGLKVMYKFLIILKIKGKWMICDKINEILYYKEIG